MQIDNELNKGLNLDANPITIPSGFLTNCLNGTIKTNNGNEGLLLNDMGNAKVGTSYLPAGYIPLGIKEYGGIVYVVSKNPITNKCLIGSFPSPGQLLAADSPNNDLCKPAKVTMTNFYNEVTKELTKTRYISRLSESLNVGDEFKIKKEDEYVEFPYYLDINGSETSKDSAFLELNVGIKEKSNNIVKLDKVEKDPNFIHGTSGELYLIQEVLLPEEFNVWFDKPTENKLTNNYEIPFHFEIDGMELTSTQISNLIYCDKSGTNTGDKFIINVPIKEEEEKPTCNVNFIPKKDDILIPQLKLNFSIDIEASRSGIINMNAWKTTWDSLRLSVKVNYGFDGAFDVKKVILKFYPLLKTADKETMNTFATTPEAKVEIAGKKSFNGYFSKNINYEAKSNNNLSENCLYLTLIECLDSSNNILYTTYNWTWTNDVVESFYNDTGCYYTYPLWVKVDGKCSMVESELTPVEGVKDDSGPSNTAKNYNYDITYQKSVNVVPDELTPLYYNLEKIPIVAPDLDKTKFSDVVNVSALKSNVIHTEYKIGSSVTPPNPVNNVTVNNQTGEVRISAKYQFTASSKQMQGLTSGHKIVCYNGSSVDRDFIYGGDLNSFPKYGLAIGAGIYHLYIGDEHIHTRIDFNTWSTNGDRSAINNIVNSNVKYKNKGDAQRSWKSGCDDYLKKFFQQKVGFYPPVSFLIGSTAGDYNDNKRKESTLHLSSKSNKAKDYMIVLWRDSTDCYRIIKTAYAKTNAPAYEKLNTIFSKLYVSDTESSVTDLNAIYVPNNNDYFYTTQNVVTANITVTRDISFVESTNNLESEVAALGDKILKAAEAITGKNVNLPAISFTIDLDVQNNTLQETKTLDKYDISGIIATYINQTYNLSRSNVYHFLNNDGSIQYEDSRGNPFNALTIYYKNSEGKLAPLNDSNKLTGSELNKAGVSASILSDFNKYFTIKLVENSAKNTKNCIVLKEGSGRSSSPDGNNVWSYPYIGEKGEKREERYTYPFTLAGKNNYKYLCDLILPGASFNLY